MDKTYPEGLDNSKKKDWGSIIYLKDHANSGQHWISSLRPRLQKVGQCRSQSDEFII